MNKRYLIMIYRVAFALLCLYAIGVQYRYGMQGQGIDFIPANFFSFFTIESNLLAILIFLIAGLLAVKLPKPTTAWVQLRGAAVLYMTITGIVYVTLLSGLEESLQTPIPWINFVLHYLMPVVVLADWFLDLPRLRLSFKQGLVWLIFPAAYLVYSLVRGPVVGWYPYPFLDPQAQNQGYAGIAVTAAVMLGITLGFIAALTWTTRLRARRA
ncbi:MAG TPA: Pr6Pr family membrane protein [Candidatus Saccharimonadia bacterium]|nr:Pr6Pr family membrane protein [Candidatus Saccharimonadia bacterium]